MGEAKRRAANDSLYGKTPKSGRGLIISCPMEIKQGKLNLISSALDPQELRFSLLFWDKLVWPVNRAFYIEGGIEEEFLQSAGVLTRPEYSVSGPVDQGLLSTYFAAFHDHERKEPGRWALAQGSNSLLIRGAPVVPGRGSLVDLHRAIPVPERDVPLDDILLFKEKRRDELIVLRTELDRFYEVVENSTDKPHAIASAVDVIDLACADVLKVSKEAGFPFSLSSLKLSFNADLKAIGSAAAGYLLGAQLPTVEGVLGTVSAASTIGIGTDLFYTAATLKKNPYRYVASFHERVF